MDRPSERFVGRAAPAEPSPGARAVAKVPAAGTGARVAARARPGPPPETAIFEGPEVTAPVFVDGTGRRGRRLRWTAYALFGLVVLALLAFWLLQGLNLFGAF